MESIHKYFLYLQSLGKFNSLSEYPWKPFNAVSNQEMPMADSVRYGFSPSTHLWLRKPDSETAFLVESAARWTGCCVDTSAFSVLRDRNQHCAGLLW